MNIYQKITKVRVELQNMKLEKTGKNQTMTYFELGDLLPAVNSLCEKYELMTRLSIDTQYDKEQAILTIFNALEPQESVDFTAPTAQAQLPHGQEIQNLGAKITYMRRYMLMTAFEIVESDIVDKVNKELTDQLTDADIKKIESAKTPEQLAKICSALKVTYKYSLVIPHYEKQMEILRQEDTDENN